MSIENDNRARLIEDLNERIGCDSESFSVVYKLHSEYLAKKNELEKSLSLANSEVPSKISAAIKKADDASEHIKMYQENLRECSEKNEAFLTSVRPTKEHLSVLVAKLRKLYLTKDYLESLEAINELNQELNVCTDSEQSVLLLQNLYEMRIKYNKGHRGDFIVETMHYWYNVLRDKLSKDFFEVLKLVKWPITSTTLSVMTPVSQETYNKFRQIVQYLFQIQLPFEDSKSVDNQDELNLCLPIRLMITPLKKRFAFHFSGNRRTNRLDRPEWFLTQILTWLRDHLPFLKKYLQPIADGLDMKINVQFEFTCGLVQLAVDRLHSLLATIVGDDSLFSHAIDECLGFDRELEGTVGFILPSTCPRITTVLTDARYIIRWLAVEKKFAIHKIDEMLSGNEWLLSTKNGSVDNEESEGIPQGADWLLSLLQTIHDRYSLLPQPGHRLQFLEMQIELCEEIRLRLTQLIGEELRHGSNSDSGRTLEGGSRLLAMLNIAHYFRQALLDWTHSVSYLHLHYYKKQFHHFTELQHLPIPDVDITPQKENPETPSDGARILSHMHHRESLSLSQVDLEASQLARHEAENLENSQSITENITSMHHDELESDSGVFEELPGLFGRLVDNACMLLCDDLVLEVKAVSRDYRNQKWHYLPEVSDWQCRSLSPALCAPLGALSTRLLRLKSALAPELFSPLWRTVSKEIDIFIFEEVVLECWWGPGGIQQFHFDMSRNLMPIFSQYTTSPEAHLPRIAESCKLLTLAKGSALLLKETIKNTSVNGSSSNDQYVDMGIVHLTEMDIIRVLNQRTDLNYLT